jgi:hypothetical protein
MDPKGKGRVEEWRGAVWLCPTVRFHSPLIEPDVPISGIRLSDWLHRMSFGSSVHAGVLLGRGSKLCLSPNFSYRPVKCLILLEAA